MDKKDLQEIKNVFLGAFEPFANAIQGDFARMDKRFEVLEGRAGGIEGKIEKMQEDITDIKSQLWKLERRVFAIEEMLTEHGRESRKHTKELQKIWKELKLLKSQDENKVDMPRFIAFEKRVGALEAEVVK